MHKFSTVAPKPSALTALRDPQAGAPMLLDVPYSTPAVPDPQAGAPARLVRTAFSAPRYENLCIIRASVLSHEYHCADGAWEGRLRSEEEVVQGHRVVVASRT